MCPSPQSRPLVASSPIQPPPGQVHLGPRVQVDDVAPHAARLVGDHPLVGELDQVAAHEARREPARAQRRDQQHRRVAAAPAALGERLLRRPDARPPRGSRSGSAGSPRRFSSTTSGTVLARRAAARRGTRSSALAARARADRRASRNGASSRRSSAGYANGTSLAAIVDEEVERVHRPDVDRELDQHVERGDAHAAPRRSTRATWLPYGSCCQCSAQLGLARRR